MNSTQRWRCKDINENKRVSSSYALFRSPGNATSNGMRRLAITTSHCGGYNPRDVTVCLDCCVCFVAPPCSSKKGYCTTTTLMHGLKSEGTVTVEA